MSVVVKIKLLDSFSNLDLPAYATHGSSGLDLRASIDAPVELAPRQRHVVDCGISLELPVGYEAQIRPRSGLAAKYGITVLNSPGTIDADYRGPLKVCLVNLGDQVFYVTRGMRIAQIVFVKIEKVRIEVVGDLASSDRDDGGFGSTGLL